MRSFFSDAMLVLQRRAAGEWSNDEFDCGLVVEVGIMTFGGFRLWPQGFSTCEWGLSLRFLSHGIDFTCNTCPFPCLWAGTFIEALSAWTWVSIITISPPSGGDFH